LDSVEKPPALESRIGLTFHRLCFVASFVASFVESFVGSSKCSKFDKVYDKARDKDLLSKMTLRLHAFLPRSRANGPGWRSVVWVQGCSLGCPGCFNPQTHDRAEAGEVAEVAEVAEPALF